jgi:hypothetical protein
MGWERDSLNSKVKIVVSESDLGVVTETGIGFAEGPGETALTPGRLQHGTKNLMKAGALLSWPGESSPGIIMSDAIHYPSTSQSFERILGNLGRVLEIDRRLPDWPFRIATGNADICQFSLAVEGPFGAVLQALVDTHGDEIVSLVVLDPQPEYHRENYGAYPAFMAPGGGIAGMYWDLVAHEPGGDPTGAVTYTANVVAMAGTSGAWAVWAERSWDLAVVLTQHTNGPWTSCGANYVSVVEALAAFTEPDFKVPLPVHDRIAFLQNVRVRGGGE